jgi:transposase
VEELIKLLDPDLVFEKSELVDDIIYLYVKSKRLEAVCPYCKVASDKVHSRYHRSFQDLPIQGKKTIIVLMNRKIFCNNPACDKRTFAESFTFLEHKSKKTTRLEDEIVNISKSVSSLAAAKILKKNIVQVGKSTICNILKKRSSSN